MLGNPDTNNLTHQMKCEVHPNETINNFCKRSECMVGLCPTCICEHTEFHHFQNTLPDYQNINLTCKVTEDMLSEYKLMLQRESGKLGQFSESSIKRNEKCWEKFHNVKAELIQMIEKYFQQLRICFEQKIKEEEVKTDLYSNFQHLQEVVEFQFNTLQDHISEFKTSKSPQLIRQIHLKLIPNVSKVLQEVKEQIEKNMAFKPIFQYNKPELLHVKDLVQRIVKIQFNHPRAPLQIRSTTPQIVVKNQRNTFDFSRSIAKPISKPYVKILNSTMGNLKNSQAYFPANSSWVKENSPSVSRVLVKSHLPSMTTTY